LITAVFRVSPQSVHALLRRQVRKRLPAELVGRAAEHIYGQASALDLYRQLRQGFELSQLLDVLYESYAAQKFAEPPRPEVKALETLLQQAHHPMLSLFVAYWLSPRKQLPKALTRADETDYRQFGALAMKLDLVKPLKLLVPGRGDAFLDLYLTAGVDMVELSKTLIEVEETACMVRLANYVSNLPGKKLKKLAKLIEEESKIPEAFHTAVEQAIAALPQNGGIKGVLRAIMRRPPKK
jgi:hypothetical protein